MAKKSIKYGSVGFNHKTPSSQINQLIQKLPYDKQQTLYQELKASGSIDNPVKYTATHLKSSMED